jgi:small-conductance mechanosensitive channel
MMYQVPIQIPETLEVETVNPIDIGEIIGAAAVFVLGYLIAYLAQRVVRRTVQRIPDTTEFAVKIAGRIAFWIGLIVGTVLSLTILGVNLGPLIATLVVVFLVLAFALRGYIENFAAGLVLQARRPFRPGHLVSVNEFHGEVR